MTLFGARVQRTEDPRLLSVGGTYVEDLVDPRLEGAGFATFVRSPVAHGTIAKIDIDGALRHDSALAVVTGLDCDIPPVEPPVEDINPAMAQPVLARDTVRYVGEPVAVVVTSSPLHGEDVAELVQVDYDTLPALVDPEAAVGDQPVLFPATGTNLCYERPASVGDDELFAGCEVVVSKRLVNQRVAAAPLEVRGAACVWDDDGLLTLWLNTQNAQASRDSICHQLGVREDRVRVIVPDVGGGFGAKIGVDPEVILLCWLSRKIGRPLRWIETRSENMVAMTHGRDQRQLVTIGGTRDGRVLAYRLEILQNAGAYPRIGAWLATITARMATGVYRIERVDTRVRAVVTNTTPTASYRGAGRPEATAAIERAIDLFALRIGIDPAVVRRKNFIPPDAFPFRTPTGATYDSGDYARSLDVVLQAARYATLRAEQRQRRADNDVRQLGIGLSSYVEVTAGDAATGEHGRVEVDTDGRVRVISGSLSQGQGHATSFAMLVADTLGIAMEMITVEGGDTFRLQRGVGTWGSRSLQLGGISALQSCRRLIEQGRSTAAELLEAAEGDLVLDTDRGVWHVIGSPSITVSWAEIAREVDPQHGIQASSHYQHGLPTYPSGTHLAVVEVDIETGKVTLRRHIAADDAGRILNPLIAEGQRHGGIAQGAAQALLEEVCYDDEGNPTTTTFADYAFMSAPELPSFELVDVQTITSANDLGVKGLGEAGTIGAAPAVQNAVVDALSHLGVEHIDMPLSPQRVWSHITTMKQRKD